MSAERRRWNRWDAVAAGVFLLVLLAHARFAIWDGRSLMDRNQCYQAVPDMYRALWGMGGTPGDAVRQGLTEMGGWYNLLLAATMRYCGRSHAVFQLFDGLWLALILACTTLIGRHLYSRRAAAVALCLVANAGIVVLRARNHWIHVAELGLLMTALTALILDPHLRRRVSVVALMLGGMGAVSLRASALIWVATLVPLVLLSLRGKEHRWRTAVRAALVLGSWGVALWPQLAQLFGYADMKMAMRARYAEYMADVGFILFGSLGHLTVPASLPSGLLALAAVAGAIVIAVRRWRSPSVIGALLLLWMLVPPALYLGFLAGLDSFPAGAVALALVGGAGLARLGPRVAMTVVGLWVAVYLVQWLPAGIPQADPDRRGLPIIQINEMAAGPSNYYRPYRAITTGEIHALVDGSCGDQWGCKVEVYRGLFAPLPEAPGTMELFITGRERVQVVPLWFFHESMPFHTAEAFSVFTCAETEPSWNQRFPQLPSHARSAMEMSRYEPVWTRDLGAGCRFTWMAPGGLFRHPELAPPGSDALPLPPDAHGFEATAAPGGE